MGEYDEKYCLSVTASLCITAIPTNTSNPPPAISGHNKITAHNLGDTTNDAIQACSYQHIGIMSLSIKESIVVAAVDVSLAVAQQPSYAWDSCVSVSNLTWLMVSTEPEKKWATAVLVLSIEAAVTSYNMRFSLSLSHRGWFYLAFWKSSAAQRPLTYHCKVNIVVRWGES